MTTVFTLEARDKNLGALLIETTERVRRLNAELRNAEDGSEEYQRLSAEIATAKGLIAETRDQQKQLNQQFKSTQVPTDSVAGLRIEYSRLSKQISELSRAERSSDFGKDLIRKASAAKVEIDKAEQSIGRFTGNVGNYKSAFEGLAPVISKVGFMFGGLFAALSGGSEIVNTTREFEKLFAMLKQASGSESEATRLFDQIKTFAKETPFQLEEVVGGFIKLENRNFNPTIEQMRTLGDIATSQGKSLNQFIEAVLDAQTGEFERLKEFGIVARKSGEDVKLTFRGQATTIKNTSENLTEYLLGLGKLPGISGSAVAISKTLDGTLSNMADNFSQLFATLGKSGGVIQTLAGHINSIVEAANDYLSVPLSDQIRDQQQEFNGLVTALINYNASSTETNETDLVRNNLISELTSKYGDYIGQIDLNNASETQLRDLMDKSNQEFERRIFLQLTQEKSSELFKKVSENARDYAQALKFAAQAQGEFNEEAVKTNDQGVPVLNVAAVEESDALERGLSAQKGALTAAEKAYQDYQKEIEETSKVLFGSFDAFDKYRQKVDEGGTATKKATAAAKEEAKAAEGSLEALRKKVKDLTDELEKASPNQVPKILGDLIKAEKELAALENRLDSLRKGRPAEQAPTGAEVEAVFTGFDDKALQDRIDKLFQGIEVPPIDIPIETDASELEAQALQAIEFNDSRLSSEEYTTEEINRLRASLTEANLTRLRTEAEEEEAQAQRKKELTEDIVEQGLEVASRLGAAIVEIERGRIERNRELALKSAELEYNERIKKAGGNAKKEAAIRKDFEKQKEAIEKQAAKKRQDIAVVEAVIAGALAVIKALPNYILAAAIAVFTGIQVAVIKSQSFATGGFTKDQAKKVQKAIPAPSQPGQKISLQKVSSPQTIFDLIPEPMVKGIPIGPAAGFAGPGVLPPDQTGRKPAGAIPKSWGLAVYHEGEYIAPASQVQKYPHIFEALEYDRVVSARPFAVGGFTLAAPAVPTQQIPATQTATADAKFSEDQIDLFAETVANRAGEMIAAKVREALGEGLNDADRRLERKAAGDARRTV